MWNMYWFPRAYNEEGNNLETLEVFVDHVIYRNESNGYCVLSADYEEEELIVTGIFQGDVQGAMLRVTGKMEYNANYGEQFKMQQYEIIEPTDAESIRRYLGSGAIKGIGESLAGRIVKRFGDDRFTRPTECGCMVFCRKIRIRWQRISMVSGFEW